MAVETLFIGAFPQAQSRKLLQVATETVSANVPGLRVVKPARLHMTVLFLGRHEAPPQRCIDVATRALDALKVRSLDLMLDHVTTLGHRRRPAVVVAATQIPAELIQLREQLAAALRCCCPAEGQDAGFKPHVTLAYATRPLSARFDAIELPFRPFRLCLVRSIRGESDYRIVAARNFLS